jgi:hypothetical protein
MRIDHPILNVTVLAINLFERVALLALCVLAVLGDQRALGLVAFAQFAFAAWFAIMLVRRIRYEREPMPPIVAPMPTEPPNIRREIARHQAEHDTAAALILLSRWTDGVPLENCEGRIFVRGPGGAVEQLRDLELRALACVDSMRELATEKRLAAMPPEIAPVSVPDEEQAS